MARHDRSSNLESEMASKKKATRSSPPWLRSSSSPSFSASSSIDLSRSLTSTDEEKDNKDTDNEDRKISSSLRPRPTSRPQRFTQTSDRHDQSSETSALAREDLDETASLMAYKKSPRVSLSPLARKDDDPHPSSGRLRVGPKSRKHRAKGGVKKMAKTNNAKPTIVIGQRSSSLEREICWIRPSAFEKEQVSDVERCRKKSQKMWDTYVAKADVFTMKRFDEEHDRLTWKERQTGTSTHDPHPQAPFPIFKPQRDKCVEELTFELLQVTKKAQPAPLKKIKPLDMPRFDDQRNNKEDTTNKRRPRVLSSSSDSSISISADMVGKRKRTTFKDSNAKKSRREAISGRSKTALEDLTDVSFGPPKETSTPKIHEYATQAFHGYSPNSFEKKKEETMKRQCLMRQCYVKITRSNHKSSGSEMSGIERLDELETTLDIKVVDRQKFEKQNRIESEKHLPPEKTKNKKRKDDDDDSSSSNSKSVVSSSISGKKSTKGEKKPKSSVSKKTNADKTSRTKMGKWDLGEKLFSSPYGIPKKSSHKKKADEKKQTAALKQKVMERQSMKDLNMSTDSDSSTSTSKISSKEKVKKINQDREKQHVQVCTVVGASQTAEASFEQQKPTQGDINFESTEEMEAVNLTTEKVTEQADANKNVNAEQKKISIAEYLRKKAAEKLRKEEAERTRVKKVLAELEQKEAEKENLEEQVNEEILEEELEDGEIPDSDDEISIVEVVGNNRRNRTTSVRSSSEKKKKGRSDITSRATLRERWSTKNKRVASSSAPKDTDNNDSDDGSTAQLQIDENVSSPESETIEQMQISPALAEERAGIRDEVSSHEEQSVSEDQRDNNNKEVPSLEVPTNTISVMAESVNTMDNIMEPEVVDISEGAEDVIELCVGDDEELELKGSQTEEQETTNPPVPENAAANVEPGQEQPQEDEEQKESSTSLNLELEPWIQQDIQHLKGKKICFKQLEFGNCIRKNYCSHSHPPSNLPDDVLRFFRVIAYCMPNQLPVFLRNRDDKRVQRLMGIYNANKVPSGMKLESLPEENKFHFFELFMLILNSVMTKEFDIELQAYFRTMVTDLNKLLSDRIRSRLIFCRLSEIFNVFLESAKLIDVPHHLLSAQQLELYNRMWEIMQIGRRNGIALGKEVYEFTLDAMVKIKSSPRGFALLSYLRFLPGFSLDHAKISCVIKLLISKADPDDVIHHVIPIVESFGREVKQLSVPVLQKVVNRCQQLLGSKTMIMTEEKIHTIKAFLFNLNKLEVPVLTIPHFPALNVLRTDQLPSEISQLMREKRWDELVALYYRNVVLENTFANMKLVSALFEAITDGEEYPSPQEMVRRFSTFMKSITRNVHPPPVEKMFMCQLAATLIVHLNNHQDGPSYDSIVIVVHSFLEEKELFAEERFYPWRWGNICHPNGVHVANTKTFSERAIAGMAVRAFIEKGHFVTASRILLQQKVEDLFCQEGHDNVRDVVEGLCLRQDPQIMDGELCETLAFLFDSVLMVMVKDNRNLLTRQQKLHICSVVFSKVLRCLLECTGTVEEFALPFFERHRDEVQILNKDVFQRDTFRFFVKNLTKAVTRSPDRSDLKEKCIHLYDRGVLEGLYPRQNLSDGKLNVPKNLSAYEMQAMVLHFLYELVHYHSIEYIKKLQTLMTSGASRADLESRGLNQFTIQLRYQNPTTQSQMRSFSILDMMNSTAAKSTLVQVLQSFSPRIYLLEDPERLDERSLINYLSEN